MRKFRSKLAKEKGEADDLQQEEQKMVLLRKRK